MTISVFPAAVTSSLNADAITATASDTFYEGRKTFDAAIYQITCASGTVANFEFWNLGTLITSGTTSSGIATINLASTADRIRLWTNTGSNIVVTITKTAGALTNQFSGTLDTVTTVGPSTYTGTSTSGKGYALLVGGGGGGGGCNPNSNNGAGGGGGGSGAVCAKIVTLTGSMAVTIGAGGLGGAAGLNAGTAGGASTFDGMTAGGGSGGNAAAQNVASPGAGGTATGGTINTPGAGPGSEGNGSATTKTYSFVVNGTTGSGSSGFYPTAYGSGIGTGGVGSASTNNGTNATGYGAGGGGASGTSTGAARAGGNGTQGVLYVLRF